MDPDNTGLSTNTDLADIRRSTGVINQKKCARTKDMPQNIRSRRMRLLNLKIYHKNSIQYIGTV